MAYFEEYNVIRNILTKKKHILNRSNHDPNRFVKSSIFVAIPNRFGGSRLRLPVRRGLNRALQPVNSNPFHPQAAVAELRLVREHRESHKIDDTGDEPHRVGAHHQQGVRVRLTSRLGDVFDRVWHLARRVRARSTLAHLFSSSTAKKSTCRGLNRRRFIGLVLWTRL